MNPRITILIPNYKTPVLTKLCLRLIRKHTDLAKAKIIVIDNDSNDESLAYLKKLNWITLIERKHEPNESPALSHAKALDVALAKVDTPYVLSIHTDTLIKNSRWLDFLIEQIESNPQVGGVGSWKLEKKSWPGRILKNVEHALQSLYYRCIRKTDHALEGIGKNFYYLRSHCALYRMDLIKHLNLTFSESEDGEHVAGKRLHKKLVENGYQMIFIPSHILLRYLDHINHATMVLNPELGSRTSSIKKGLNRINKRLEEFQAQEILANDQIGYLETYMADDTSENKNEPIGPIDWFDSIKDIFENPSIPKEWMDYLQKIYAYLDIGSLSHETAEEKSVSLIKVEKSGWIIHDYGSHIAVSSGDYAHGLRESDKEGENPSPGYGTIVAQSWNSAQKVVELARQRWPEDANLIGGTPFMQFAAGYWAWLANYEIFGLAIHKSDQLAYEQIKTLLGQTADLTSEQRPR